MTAHLGLLFGPLVLAPFLPRWWDAHGQRYTPGAAVDSLTLPQLAGNPEQLGTGVAALTVAAWLAAFSAWRCSCSTGGT